MEHTTDGPIDIVDSQVHLFHTTGVEGGIAALNALGIRAALLDEFWGYGENGERRPGHALPNGVWRSTSPQVEQACNLHQERFSYLTVVDYLDPMMESRIQLIAEAPLARAVRIGFSDGRPSRMRDLAEGRCRSFFGAAAKFDVPVFVLTTGRSDLLRPYIEEFSSLAFIVDHVGMARTEAQFEDVLRLADFPNCYLKWCHAEGVFGSKRYPFPETAAPLRRAIDAFGAHRIMWASDFTMRMELSSWADRLYYIRESSDLTAEEKAWILGRTARKVLKWPTAEPTKSPTATRKTM